MRERYSPNSPLAARFGIASGKLDDIHVRIKLLRNAIEQRKGPAYHQQICGKTADALHKLHSGADSINVFPSFTRLLTEQHSGQVQERGNVHLALEAKSSVTQRLVDTGEITASQRLRQFIE